MTTDPDPPQSPEHYPDAVKWAEYLQRYDLYLALYARWLDQQTAYIRLCEQSARWQRQKVLWVSAIVALTLLIAIVAPVFFP